MASSEPFPLISNLNRGCHKTYCLKVCESKSLFNQQKYIRKYFMAISEISKILTFDLAYIEVIFGFDLILL